MDRFSEALKKRSAELAEGSLMRRTAQLLEIAAAAAVVSACSDDSTGPQADPCTAETSAVEATVAIGTDVVFDWAPECHVALLLVEGDEGDTWLISTSEDDWDSPELANRIAPPVTYGRVPSGIPETWGPEPLIAGGSYDLILYRILPSGSSVQCEVNFGNACALAIQTFTR